MKTEKSKITRFAPVKRSLADLVGTRHLEAVVRAHAALSKTDAATVRKRARQRVEFFPSTMQRRLDELLPSIGTRIARPVSHLAAGATSAAYEAASMCANAPLCGYGYYRVGEDGVLRFISKSEHYHAAFGHAFPGFALIDTARRLGFCSATHNNTRGHVVRRLEEALVLLANGLDIDGEIPDRIAASRRPEVLNRVMNIETGSLAAEAAIKIMLARFYRVEPVSGRPVNAGKVPVFIVVGDKDGNLPGNYHGTTVLAQTLRGMWPELTKRIGESDIYRVVAVRPNDLEGFGKLVRRYHRGRFRVAGFLHELLMMNYGATLLDRSFLRGSYRLCRERDIPVMVDEIQTGIWSPKLLLFREFGLRPNLVALGKGFPGGEYPTSRLLFSAAYDTLPQFGALVTNGQNEVASLAYLVTMHWMRANAEPVAAVGDLYERGLRRLARRYRSHVDRLEGRRHLSALYFHRMKDALGFAQCLVEGGFDISVQAYKQDAPPSALTKLPVIVSAKAVSMILEKMEEALESMKTAHRPQNRGRSLDAMGGERSRHE